MLPQLYVLVGTGIAAFLIGGTVSWQVQGWRHGEELATIRSDALESQNRAEKAARSKETEFNTKLNEARNAATKRTTQLRTDLDSAGRTADGLRDTLYAFTGKLPSATITACRNDAAALAKLLADVEREGRGMAEAADRHRSDSLMYQEAWPTK